MSGRPGTTGRALALAAMLALTVPAQAAGPVEKRRDELPKPIAALHACAGMQDHVHWRAPDRAGSAGFLFSVSCPLDGPGVSAIASQKPWQQHQHLALYVAANAAGHRARRIVLPWPQPDGREVAVNVVPVTPSIGWSSKTQTSGLTKAAYLDRDRNRLRAGQFHLLMQLYPADRPHLKSVIAIWQVTMHGEGKLIYWAETTEELRGENPHYVYPRYVTLLDARPEQ